MISQTKIKKQLKNSDLRFVIIVGKRGSGKKTLLRELYGDTAYWLPDNSVDTIRTMIREANKRYDTVFIIPDADGMSITAKNALLKVVEECKNNNVFIMTVQDEYNILETLTSRAMMFFMENYTVGEIGAYCETKYPEENNSADYVLLCETPGEVDTLMRMGGRSFLEYMQKVVAHIDKATLANALKIGNSVAFKDGDDKYDLEMFWKAFTATCLEKVLGGDDTDKYLKWSKITSNALRQLRTPTANKSALFTLWVLDIRGE